MTKIIEELREFPSKMESLRLKNRTLVTGMFAATLGMTLLAGAPAHAEDAAPEVTVSAEPTVEATTPAVEVTTPAVEETTPAAEPTVPAEEAPAEEAPATEAPAVETPTEEPTADPSDQPVAETPAETPAADNTIPADETAAVLPAGEVQASVVFDNCSDAAAAGAFNIPSTDPRYGTHLDSDLDGIGCENKDAAPAADVTVDGALTTGNVQASTYTPASSSELAYTGAADWALPLGGGIAGIGALLFGASKLRRRNA